MGKTIRGKQASDIPTVDAPALTKRLLGWAYLWVGDSNGVQIQIYTTWIFYAVLNDLCVQVSVALHQRLVQISLEMVFRGLDHFAQALERGEAEDVISYFLSSPSTPRSSQSISRAASTARCPLTADLDYNFLLLLTPMNALRPYDIYN